MLRAFLPTSVLLLAFSTLLAATGLRHVNRITGHVVDAVTGRPIQFVTVKYTGSCGFRCVADSSRSEFIDFTDTAGNFSMVTECHCEQDSSQGHIWFCGNFLDFRIMIECELDGYVPTDCLCNDDLLGGQVDSITKERVLGPYTIKLTPDLDGSARRPWTGKTPTTIQELHGPKTSQ